MNQTSPRYQIRSIRDLEIKSKRLLMRLDLNVPIHEGKVTDDNRIVEALPTIQYAIEKGAKIILCSHLGRPEGKVNSEFSMEPVANRLAELLNTEVLLADDSVGEGIELMAQNLKDGQIMLLENLRFYAGEESNDVQYARRLAHLCEIFVSDAFGTAHRRHASTFGVPEVTPVRGMGFLIEKELKFLDKILHQSEAPFYAVLGGSKVSDKIKTIESLFKRVDGLLIGGAMAHAFWKVKGIPVPENAKQPKPLDIAAAEKLLKLAAAKELPLIIPEDTIDGFDIGPKTIETFCKALSQAKTIFWNGPLGWFEKPEYSKGTFEVAKFLATHPAIKVVGGGDTVSAIKQSGYSSGFDHLSTGGGAVLEYLEQEGLPGIEVLRSYLVTSANLEIPAAEPKASMIVKDGIVKNGVQPAEPSNIASQEGIEKNTGKGKIIKRN